MDMPSTSFDFIDSDVGPDCIDAAYMNMFSMSNDLNGCGDAADPHAELLGFLEAQIELCDQLLDAIEVKRKKLSEKKAWIEKKMEQDRRQDCTHRNKVPVIQYLPPYFKDENMMCPPQNEEAKHKLQYTTFDPLTKEDKKWTSNELRLLRVSVMNSVIQASIQKFADRKDILRSKVQRAGVETSVEELEAWKEEIKALDRKIEHLRADQVDSKEMNVFDYSCVDWLKISTVEFKGARSAATLRYKWLNEQCPRWNSGPWTKEELEQLRQLREDASFTSWSALAVRLGTERPPYQCFERYRSDMCSMAKDWTKEEDSRLVALVKMMTVNGSVQWDKVSFYMPGRNRQQVRTRYQRTLDENVRHGRWTDHEDLLLMSAVARFGAKDWGKVAKAVVGRSDGQCRERWCNVLDRCTETGEWTAEEDERLVFGVQVFGRGQWAKIAEILPRHNPESIRRRYQRLLATKMRLFSEKIAGYPVIYNMSSVSAAVHKARRDTMRQQLTNDGPKGDRYRAAKQQAAKNPSSKITLRRGNKLTDEEKAILEKGVEEISEKYRNEEHTPRVTDVIKKINLTKEEVTAVITAAKKSTYRDGRRRVYRYGGPSGVKKIRKNMYLLPDTLFEKTVFTPEETEEERIIYLTEALCRAVRKYDQYEWCNKFYEGRDDPENVTCERVANMLHNRCMEVAESLKQCVQPPLDTTLAPTFTTASAYRVFEKARLSLTRRASCYFCPTNQDARDVFVVPGGDVIRKFTVHDRLNIQLHPDILRDDHFLKLKAQVRCLLREPTRLAFSIDPPEVEQQRNRTQMELVQAIMDEQTFRYEAHGFADVGSEVVISSIEDYEPIDYEDAADDALNQTVDTIMDKVCNRPEQWKRKRGRPSREEALLGALDVSDNEANKSVKRVLPSRSLKGAGLAVAGGNCSDDYYSELESDSDGDWSPMALQNTSWSRAHMEDVERSLSKEMDQSTTFVPEVQKAENSGKVCDKVDPPKRKRGRLQKTAVV